MSSEVGSRIAKNSIFNLIRTIIAVPVMLSITPYIIRHLGKEEFGLWALVGVISSYAQLSDFGITESLIKFIAEFKARGESQRLNHRPLAGLETGPTFPPSSTARTANT